MDSAIGALGAPVDAPFQGLVQCPQSSGVTNGLPANSTYSTVERFGSGYLSANPLTDASGHVYQLLSDDAIANAYKQSGGTWYFLVSPGTSTTPALFQPVNANTHLAPNTPLYGRQSTTAAA